MDNDRARLDEIESMLRDPQLTDSKRSALHAERAALLGKSKSSTGPGPAGSAAQADTTAASASKSEVPTASPASHKETLVETGATSAHPTEPSPWKAGLAVAKDIAQKALRVSVDTNYMDDTPDAFARRAGKGAAHAIGGTLLHTGVAAAAGFALGGPVGAIALPLINGFMMQGLSTLALSAAPMAAYAGIKLAEIGTGLLDKLHDKRTEAIRSEPLFSPTPRHL